MARYLRNYTFEAARRLGVQPQSERSTELHGHSFEVAVAHSSTNADHEEVFANIDESMHHVLKKLDYQYLNASTGLKQPTDIELLKWMAEQLRGCQLDEITLSSVKNSKVTYVATGHVYQSMSFQIQAAHFLPNVPEGHKCHELHGHNFQVVFEWDCTRASYETSGEHALQVFVPLLESMDQQLLNEIPGLENPTSENIAAWIWKKMRPELPSLKQVTVHETSKAGSHYDGELWNCFKFFEMDSAITWKGKLKGHSYGVRLHILKDLDPHMGWTLDFTEIKNQFKPFFKQLDHHHLNDVLSTETPSLLAMGEWIHKNLQPHLKDLYQIHLWNTEASGVIYDCRIKNQNVE